MRAELRYGLLAAVAMTGWTLLESALGIHRTRFALGEYTGWGTEIILLVMLWRLHRHQFARLDRYWLPVWEGVLHGALASLVAGLAFYVFLSLYINILNPAWPDLYLIWQVGRMRAAGNDETTVRAFIRSFRWMQGPTGLAMITVGLYTLIGIAVSPILTLWLNWRHKEPASFR